MARRAAGVRARADGMLEKRFTVDGKRYSVYGRTSKDIQKKEQELRQQIQQGLYMDNRNITLDQYFKEWKVAKRGSVKPNTIRAYSCFYNNHISPVLGKKKVQKIERREVLKLQRAIKDHKSANTANRVVVVLNILLKDAVRDEIIIKNPAESIKPLKISDNARDTIHRALTEEEQACFMEELKSDHYYSFIAFLLCTGMRTGEAAALTWSDIDYKQNVIHITKTGTLSENGEQVIGAPKSKAGMRDIPMNDTIKTVLRDHRERFYGDMLPMGNLLVFTSIYDKMIRSKAVNDAIHDALERLDKKLEKKEEGGLHIEPFTAHALRDTFATRYIEQGGTPQTLKTILGHSSLAMTMDLYSHVLPNTKQEEMNRVKIAIG